MKKFEKPGNPCINGELFIHLENVEQYFPGLWDLSCDKNMLKRWQHVFQSNFEHLLELVKTYRDEKTFERATEACQVMNEFLEALERRNLVEFYKTVHHITIFREELLTKYHVDDPYRDEKKHWNNHAFNYYPLVIKKLDNLVSLEDKLRECCILTFAGNIFDLGSIDIARQHQQGKLLYDDLVDQVRSQEWFINHLDKWLNFLWKNSEKNQGILFFVDNAGYDFICGCIPLARTLAEQGYKVVIAANEMPAINDITFEEALVWFNRLQTVDPVLRSLKDNGQLRIITSGNKVPGIDFRSVSRFVNMDGNNSVHMILEGQGRAIETNWNTQFSISCTRISTVKEKSVATKISAKPFDLVLRFDESCDHR